MANKLEYTLSLKDQFTSKLRSAESSTSKLDSKMSKLGGMVAGAFSVGAVVAFGSKVKDALVNYEYFHASLNVLLGRNVNATRALENQLSSLAATTPFSLTDVQDSTKKLLAYGFRAGEVVDTIKTLGDVSAATGNNIGDVAYLYGTLRTQGKAMTKDLYQFTNRGINLLPILAKKFKVTEDKIYDLASAGKISFKDIETAFKTMTGAGGQFFGMMDEQSKTVGGQISNMGDSWDRLLVSIGKSQTGIIASTINMANGMISEIGKVIENSNKMDEAFKDKKLKGAGFWEQVRGVFGNTELRGQRNLVRDLTKMSDFASEKNTSEAISSQMGLMYAAKIKESKLFASGKGSKENYDKRLAIFDYFINGLKGSLDVLNTPAAKANKLDENGNPVKTTKESKSIGTGIDVVGTRPQSLIININELVHELKLTASTLTEGTMKIKEEIAKALLEAVNDLNYITR